MKSWMVKASIGIISVKQEAHVISFYQNEYRKDVENRLQLACQNDSTHTARLCQ